MPKKVAEGSRAPTCSQYKVKQICGGCGRALVIKDEAHLWFQGWPSPAVFGYCCWTKAAVA